MELKEQIEQLEKQLSDWGIKIQELKNQIKPKIEVGKWYKSIINKALYFVYEYNHETTEGKTFGFNYNGDWMNLDVRYYREKGDILADEKEVVESLTRYCDELYKDCDRVDRSGLDVMFETTARFIDEESTELVDGKFQYKGLYVMDKHGKFAKGLKREVKDYDVEIKGLGCYVLNWEGKGFEKGKYKLVPVD